MEEIRRDEYLEKLHAGRGLTDVVKVITGMRRAGKSTILRQYRDDLVASGVDEGRVVTVNFEDFGHRDVDTSEKLDALMEGIIGDGGAFHILLDEIQNVDGWERTVSSLVNTGRCDVCITGSNSRMLSSELATHIAGRYVEVRVLPLSFREYMELHPGDRTERFNQFLRYGALPEVDPSRGDGFCSAQLEGIFNTVLVNDVMARLGMGDVRTLRSIARFLYSNVGNLSSVDSIAKGVRASNATVGRYLDRLLEAFLFYESERYDIVGRRLLETNGKFYASDLGLRNHALQGAGGTDMSRPLENVVYLELVRRGYTVRTGSFRDSEVDFTAVRGDRTEYYQVCLTMMSEDTRARELRPLNGIRDNFRKVVLTMDAFGLGSENGIEIVNVLDWLMDGGRTSPR